MAVDWITVSAQIVNFLILVWLLKRFLYQPVMGAMDRREQRIAARLEEAEARERLAEESARDHRRATEDLDRTREGLVAEARAEAEAEKRRLLDEARSEVAGTRSHWQRQAAQEKEEFLRNLQKQTAEAIQFIARETLADLADAELEDRIVNAFIRRLETLDDETLRKALARPSVTVSIVSAFELPAHARTRLTRAIHENFADGIEVEYAQSPDLLCGIELNAAGRRLSWNLDDYLDQLGGRVDELLSPTPA